MRYTFYLSMQLAALCLLSFSPVYAAPSSLDSAFGVGGISRHALSTGNDRVHAMAVQADGKIVVTSLCNSESELRICLMRLTALGARDTSFGQQGVAATTLSTTSSSSTASIAMAADSKIVVATACRIPSAATTAHTRFCVARFNANGSSDSSFGNAGVVTTTMSGGTQPSDVPTAVFIRPNGTITVTGNCKSDDDPIGTELRLCTARYLPQSGALDGSYGSGGIAFHTNAAWAANEFEGATAVMAPNGLMWIAGRCTADNLVRGCVVATAANGTLITGFGAQGLQTFNFSDEFAIIVAIALQRDGKLLVGATCAQSSGFAFVFCIARLSPTSGALDPTFSANFAPSGLVRTSFGPQTVSALSRVAIDDDGAIIAAGTCYGNAVPTSAMCVARYRPEGYLDTSFGPSGTLQLALADTAVAYDLIKQPSGRIILGGSCQPANAASYDSCLVALEGGPQTYSRCSLDIDGDGSISATDSLIWSRLMFDFSIARAISGVSFSADALRNTEPTIREFLARQCGVEVNRPIR
jgi:uncharacterized delta-60 repeat protein